jgi:hypothetical protein
VNSLSRSGQEIAGEESPSRSVPPDLELAERELRGLVLPVGMRDREHEHAPSDDVLRPAVDLEPPPVGENAPPVAHDEVAGEPPLVGLEHANRGLRLGKSARALERIDPKDDALDDDRRARLELLVGNGEERRGGETLAEGKEADRYRQTWQRGSPPPP